jgi:hypothetical protein
MVPLGTERKAIRVGTTLVAFAAKAIEGYIDCSVGSAIHAPMPRKKLRRLKASCRSAARFRLCMGDLFVFFAMSVGRRDS